MSDIMSVFKDISQKQDADIFLFNAKINNANADELINQIRSVKKRKKNIILVLTTNGGDPDAGYRIVRIIKQYYDKGRFFLYVFGFCKSTGTLIALGADEIVMGDLAEFGPLDIQLSGGDELTNTSGLSYLQSLIVLNEKIYSSFEDNFINLKGGYGITTKTAAEIGSKLAIGIIEPISAQIDPLKLGEVQRAIKIASAYGERILGINNDDIESVKKLIGNYPSHTFVIDFKEMVSLFPKKKIRRPNDEEYQIEGEIYGIVRKEGKKKYIVHCNPEDESTPENQEQNGQEQKPVANPQPVGEQPQGNGQL
jgi:hypothetical protein